MRDTSLYVIQGIRVPSVTEVLEIAGFTDWAHVPPNVLEFAAVRGRDVHDWLEGVDAGVLDGLEPDPRIAAYVAAYQQFKEDSGFKPELIEHVVLNEAYGYAGTLDRTGILRNGERWLLDLKTVATVTPESALQTAGYAACLEEPHRRGVLQLRKDGTYKLHPYSDRNDIHDFLSAVRVAHWKLKHGRAQLD